AVRARGELLDNVMLYWVPAAGASSARLYWESVRQFDREPVAVPTGCSIFPKEIIRSSRRWVEQRFSDLRHWNELEKGGHFAAFEQPEAFVNALRAFFRLVRWQLGTMLAQDCPSAAARHLGGALGHLLGRHVLHLGTS